MRSVSSGEADSSSIMPERVDGPRRAQLLGLRPRPGGRLSASARSASSACPASAAGPAPLMSAGSRAKSSSQRSQHRRRVERGRRMVERVEDHAPPAELRGLRLAVHPGDPVLLAGEELGREVPERCDDARLDQRDLPEEMRLARLDLVRHRIPVPGRPALERVRDVHVLTAQPDARQQPVEQLSRLADERVSLLVLVESRRLADEHQICVRVADAEHDLCPALRQPASGTAGDLRGVGSQPGARVRASRSCPPKGGGPPVEDVGQDASVAAATAPAATAAAPAGGSAEAGLFGGAVSREHGELTGHLRPTAVRAVGIRAVDPHQILEVALALHADELVDRHRRPSVGTAADAAQPGR